MWSQEGWLTTTYPRHQALTPWAQLNFKVSESEATGRRKIGGQDLWRDLPRASWCSGASQPRNYERGPFSSLHSSNNTCRVEDSANLENEWLSLKYINEPVDVLSVTANVRAHPLCFVPPYRSRHGSSYWNRRWKRCWALPKRRICWWLMTPY